MDLASKTDVQVHLHYIWPPSLSKTPDLRTLPQAPRYEEILVIWSLDSSCLWSASGQGGAYQYYNPENTYLSAQSTGTGTHRGGTQSNSRATTIWLTTRLLWHFLVSLQWAISFPHTRSNNTGKRHGCNAKDTGMKMADVGRAE